jgi:hypothetical protein
MRLTFTSAAFILLRKRRLNSPGDGRLQQVLHLTSLQNLFQGGVVSGFLATIEIMCPITGANYQHPALL